ncbi:MAG: hypothetical protein A2X34_05220 [Elusimicrobia bacterium GWC2_51_8]|nr:MAG: hypothetical protein A2X33_05975 [Elusimicrobia bacterium GWA2_51_34]OGR58003.1 MAG: hypothetical protein A2X34_05220 [Elusimicrobia bacterium GWC2_51_8]OGR88194.1 MAG: hypothetical protein A2021_01120 [Elusimicrobia bacterium GWF2_52_66]HAF95398.1 hypothetical protein [Elusimicrobiota bacterium]HCD38049.1 hypothetical protein [Candidatus Omnitrophota bacterium]
MEIIPVLDILGGIAVGAIKGEREKYKPLVSVLAPSHSPLDFAAVFKNRMGFKRLYIADLDSILNNGNNYGIIREIKKKSGLRIMLDPGIRNIDKFDKSIFECCDDLILGTETLGSTDNLSWFIKAAGQKKVIISIDIKEGRTITACPGLSSEPFETITSLFKSGARDFILLNLSGVGTLTGVPGFVPGLMRKLSEIKVNVITGGGVTSIDDIIRLSGSGISGVLIATSLHRGNITVEDLEKAG